MADSFNSPCKRSDGDQPVVFHVFGQDITKRHLWKLSAGVLLIAALAVGYQFIDPAAFQAAAREWPAPLVVTAIALLPLVGFPVSWLHLVAGLCFGFVGGFTVVLLTTTFHHVAGWTLVRLLPRKAFKRLEPWKKKLAGAGHREATLLGGLIPGMPYVVHLYVLPLIGTPFVVLCGFGVLVHTTRAFVTILLGDQSGNLTPGRIAALVVYYAIIFGLCGWALRNLQRRLKRKQPAQAKSASATLTPYPSPRRS